MAVEISRRLWESRDEVDVDVRLATRGNWKVYGNLAGLRVFGLLRWQVSQVLMQRRVLVVMAGQ